MYFGASAFLIVIGIVLMVAPRDSTRTLPLDLIGVVFLAVGVAGLLANLTRRLRAHRVKARLGRSGFPVTTASKSRHQQPRRRR